MSKGNQPAFPVSNKHRGITLRDHMALEILKGLLAGNIHVSPHSYAIDMAYDFADAMLAKAGSEAKEE